MKYRLFIIFILFNFVGTHSKVNVEKQVAKPRIISKKNEIVLVNAKNGTSENEFVISKEVASQSGLIKKLIDQGKSKIVFTISSEKLEIIKLTLESIPEINHGLSGKAFFDALEPKIAVLEKMDPKEDIACILLAEKLQFPIFMKLIIRKVARDIKHEDISKKKILKVLTKKPPLLKMLARQYYFLFGQNLPVDIDIDYGFNIAELYDYDRGPPILDFGKGKNRLNLSHLRLKNLKGLDEIPLIDKVTFLNLSNNQIKKIPSGIFKELPSLYWLYLDHNKITEIEPDTFVAQTNLSWLNLSHNLLTNISQSMFKGLQNLEWLDLSYNQIKDLPENVFKDLGNLQRLNLESNQIQEIVPGSFSGLGNLTALYLGLNKITELKPSIFKGLKNLTDLYLTDNQLTDIPKGRFAYLSKLKILTLNFNKIKTLAQDAFINLKRLERLYLDHNQIEETVPNTFTGLHQLFFLDFTNNPIKSQKAVKKQVRAILRGVDFRF